jgi:uncharacterized protein with von Willebrand factor type A (vWA) domain
MAPYELFSSSINPYSFYSHKSQTTSESRLVGIDSLREMKEKFPYSVWLNPEPERLWWETTIEAIGGIVPMYFMSIDGIKKAMKDLLV